MKDGFLKIAGCSPEIVPACPSKNADIIINHIIEAEKCGAKIIVFPELITTGVSIGDLLASEDMLKKSDEALLKISKATAGLDIVAVIGTPFEKDACVYSGAAVVSGGKILGITAKKYFSKYNEPYPNRALSSWSGASTRLDRFDCLAGTNLIFAEKSGLVSFAPIVGEDLFSVSPVAANHCLAGALLITGCLGYGELAGSADKFRAFTKAESNRLLAGFALSFPGVGESTSDITYGGRTIIAESGEILAEGPANSSAIVYSEIDVQFLRKERNSSPYFTGSLENYEYICFDLKKNETVLTRTIKRYPFIPTGDDELKKRCEDILSIQSAGLVGRMKKARINKCILGISGGLDSTLALLVMVRAVDALALSRKNVIAVTMPCYGTTSRTRSNAEILCEMLGVDFRVIDIKRAVSEHLKDIGHDGVTADVTFENAQARERTQILFDLGNIENALVIGTGDLSEAALGWCTYNGDNMSSYGVNSTLPKTLIRKLVAYEATRIPQLKSVLADIIATPVSPELIPSNNDKVVQSTENIIGPYELHDFFIYNYIRRGAGRAKLLRLARQAFPDYDKKEIEHWLDVFLKRLFGNAFKRVVSPDGVRTGIVGLSTRSDLIVPSDTKLPD